MTTIRNLETLRDTLAAMPAPQSRENVESVGLPYHIPSGGIDWASLPTFGGDEPADTTEIWSWDETRLLVGESAATLQIVNRADYDI